MSILDDPEALTQIAIRAFARAKDEAIRENDRLGVPSYGSEGGKIVVRQPPPRRVP
jgi:succinate dehydrogenase/fumarate reductase flavoprotein subunit